MNDTKRSEPKAGTADEAPKSGEPVRSNVPGGDPAKIDTEVYETGIKEDDVSPHPGLGGILADPKGETDRRGG